MAVDLNEVKEIKVLSGSVANAVNERLKTGVWKIIEIKVVERQYYVGHDGGFLKKEPVTVCILGRVKDAE